VKKKEDQDFGPGGFHGYLMVPRGLDAFEHFLPSGALLVGHLPATLQKRGRSRPQSGAALAMGNLTLHLEGQERLTTMVEIETCNFQSGRNGFPGPLREGSGVH